MALANVAAAAQMQSDVPAVQMIAVNKWYGEFHVLRDINLTVDLGEKIVICVPSGSGKSTLIRCINRLEEHQKGRIIVDGIYSPTTRRSTKSAARSAWYSSISTCSRTCRCWRT
jgi:general L-amino acid transport system ATP-binding protein